MPRRDRLAQERLREAEARIFHHQQRHNIASRWPKIIKQINGAKSIDGLPSLLRAISGN
jgi:hypothetical protein